MTDNFRIAIVGSGPSGLSAAAHAAELGVSHVLLEAEQHPADTIYKYQKGKHVMAEPSVLPLRSPMSFAAGTREEIIGAIDGLEIEHIRAAGAHALTSTPTVAAIGPVGKVLAQDRIAQRVRAC